MRTRLLFATAFVLVLAAFPVRAESANMIMGLVLAPSGAPLAGAEVIAEALGTYPSTTPAPMNIVARGITDGAGAFSLIIPSTRELVDLTRQNDDRLNLMIHATWKPARSGQIVSEATPSPETNAVDSLIDAPLEDGQASTSTVLTPVIQLYAAVQAMAANASTVNGLLLQSPNQVILTTTNVRGFAARASVECNRYHPTVEVVQSSDVYGNVGEFHAYRDVHGWAKYGRTADSDIGVKVDQGNGWKASGTVHMGNTRNQYSEETWNRPAYTGQEIWTQFHFVKEKTTYACDPNGGYTPAPTYRVRSTGWNGGAINGTDRSYNDGYDRYSNTGSCCKQRFAKGTEHASSRTRAHMYGVAFTVFGLGLNARSGYSETVRMHWYFGYATDYHYLIGWPADRPITTAEVLYSY